MVIGVGLSQVRTVLVLATVAFFLIGLGTWEWARKIYWRIFSWVIPSPKGWSHGEVRTPIPYNGLQITKAVWRCVDDPTFFNEVTDAANALIRDAKVLTLRPDNRVFGDPCNRHKPYKHGHHKNLELSYVFNGNKLISEYDEPHALYLTERWEPAVTLDQHSPFLAHRPSTKPDKCEQCDIQRKEIDRLNAELEPYRRDRAETADRAKRPPLIPPLLVHYEKDPKGIYEVLTFTNDSTSAISGITIGPLQIRDSKNLSLFDKVPALLGKSSTKSILSFEEWPGSLTSLSSFLREKTGQNAVRIVPVRFFDSKGIRYVQEFSVDSLAFSGLIWNAGAVRLDEDDAKAEQ